MPDKYFLDTNIFVYSFDEASPGKQARAQELIEDSIKANIGLISFQVVQEFFNVALSKFVVPLSLPDAEVYLAMVLRPLCRVNSSVSLYDTALKLKGRFKFSFYDSLIVAAALQANCSILYSEDFQDGLRVENLRIKNPF